MKKEINKRTLNYQIKSFRWAFEGLSEFFKTETKAWLHVSIAIIVISVCLLIKLNSIEWCLVLSAIFGVFISELINTALERLSDKLQDAADATRKTVKDMGAAIVLLAAAYSIGVALLIIFPKLMNGLKS